MATFIPQTPWFSALQNPTRRGWYEVKYFLFRSHRLSGITRLFWNGKRWIGDDGKQFCFYKDLWRGLKKDYRIIPGRKTK